MDTLNPNLETAFNLAFVVELGERVSSNLEVTRSNLQRNGETSLINSVISNQQTLTPPPKRQVESDPTDVTGTTFWNAPDGVHW